MDRRRNIEIQFKDQVLTCIECGEDFVWTQGEQLYFRDRRLSPPRRCPRCRLERRKRTTPDPKYYSQLDDTLARAREEIKRWR